MRRNRAEKNTQPISRSTEERSHETQNRISQPVYGDPKEEYAAYCSPNRSEQTEISSETFVTTEMDNGTLDGSTSDVQAMREHDSAPLVALESEELIAADVEIVLNSALDNIEKEMINMCEVEIQVDVSDFVEKDELVGLG